MRTAAAGAGGPGGMAGDVEELNRGKSFQEQLSGETNTQVGWEDQHAGGAGMGGSGGGRAGRSRVRLWAGPVLRACHGTAPCPEPP